MWNKNTCINVCYQHFIMKGVLCFKPSFKICLKQRITKNLYQLHRKIKVIKKQSEMTAKAGVG